jgi:hypothetical protein
MSLQDGREFAVAVPQPRRLVSGPGQDAKAVWRESAALYPSAMSLEDRRQRPAVAVPQSHHGVPAGGQDTPAVGRERRAQDRGVLLEGGDWPGIIVRRLLRQARSRRIAGASATTRRQQENSRSQSSHDDTSRQAVRRLSFAPRSSEASLLAGGAAHVIGWPRRV